MDILIPIALLIVGAVIGFFAAHYHYKRNLSQINRNQAENDLKAVLSQQAEHHLYESRQLIDSVEKSCQQLHEKLNSYESLLTPDETGQAPAVPFFGEHASTYLRNNLNQDARARRASTETQPKDFANASSGLFVGETNEELAKSADNGK